MTIVLVLTALVLIGIDRAVKIWAVEKLQPVGHMDFINIGKTDVLDLTYLENNGAIFGSMSGQRWFLIGFTSIVIVIGIYAMFRALKHSKFLSFTIMLFVSGGIGNLIDRIRFGYVVDMFDIKLFNFAIFNVADICVTCAFVMIFVYTLIVEPIREKKRKANVSEQEKEVGDE